MEKVRGSDAPPAEPPAEAAENLVRPGPCRLYLVWGVLLTLIGGLLLWLGIVIYVENMWNEGSGKLTVAVIGSLVLLGGLTASVIGISRAGEGIDYLVRQSR